MFTKPYIVGKCKQMCPEGEIKMRERNKLLHPMEILVGTHKEANPKADKNKVVKEFCRSSAGQDMQKPSVLRPYEVLMDTIIYLLIDAAQMDEFSWHVKYDFICDRLRAVRQDMTILNMSKQQSICLLQPMVKFYAYISYKMCKENLRNYDPHLNNKQFQECLKRLLSMYDECDIISSRCKSVNYSTVYGKYRPFIEAIYILFNIESDDALNRGLNLDIKLRQTLEVQAAVKISLLYRRRNYITVCRMILALPCLLAAVAALHLPNIRHSCIQTMAQAYNSASLQFPLDKLQEILCYSTMENLLEDLQHCGLECKMVDNVWDNGVNNKLCGGVVFSKNKFKKTIKMITRKEQFVEDKLQHQKMEELLLV